MTQMYHISDMGIPHQWQNFFENLQSKQKPNRTEFKSVLFCVRVCVEQTTINKTDLDSS